MDGQDDGGDGGMDGETEDRVRCEDIATESVLLSVMIVPYVWFRVRYTQ